MIEVKLSVALKAHAAFSRIGATELPPKGSYRVARIISKLATEKAAFEQTQRRLFLDNGAVENGMAVQFRPPVIADGESEEAFAARKAEYEGNIKKLSHDLDQVLSETVKIDFDPIPIGLLEAVEFDRADPNRSVVKSTIKPNDMADVLDFIGE